MNCCLCGRGMASAAIFIGSLPVGPSCARRAGLVEAAKKGAGLLRLVPARGPRVRQPAQTTLDLFPEVAHDCAAPQQPLNEGTRECQQ